MQKLKTFLTVIGAVTILVLAANSAVYAATGGKFVLGSTNKAGKVSTLKRTHSGAALNLVTKSSANPPMTVNGRGKVTNLNADRLDGRDSSSFASSAIPAAHLVAFGEVRADGTSGGIVGPATPGRSGTGFYSITIPNGWPGCSGTSPVVTITPMGTGVSGRVYNTVAPPSCGSGSVIVNLEFTDVAGNPADPTMFWFTVLVAHS